MLRAHGVLSGILADAVKGKRLAVNPAKGVENLPRKTARRHVYLSADDVHRLAGESGEHRALVLTLGFTSASDGARPSRCGCVMCEFLKRRLSVQENAVQLGVDHAVGPTKGRKARSVPVPAFVLDALSVQCKDKAPGDLVFSGRTAAISRGRSRRAGGSPRRSSAPAFRPSRRMIFATLARVWRSAPGSDVLALQRMLGHTSAKVTLDTYADLFDTDLDAVAATLTADIHAKMCSKCAHETPTSIASKH